MARSNERNYIGMKHMESGKLKLKERGICKMDMNKIKYVVCINNEGYQASLELHKLYQVLRAFPFSDIVRLDYDIQTLSVGRRRIKLIFHRAGWLSQGLTTRQSTVPAATKHHHLTHPLLTTVLQTHSQPLPPNPLHRLNNNKNECRKSKDGYPVPYG